MRATIHVVLAAALAAGLAAVAPVVAVPGAGAATRHPMTIRGSVSRVSEYRVLLHAGSTTTFQTTHLRPSTSDPVLNLLTSAGTQVKANDNLSRNRKAARIVYRAAKTGWYRLIARSRSQSSAGTTTILRNGKAFVRNAAFGGWHVTVPGMRARETLSSQNRPGGANSPH